VGRISNPCPAGIAIIVITVKFRPQLSPSYGTCAHNAASSIAVTGLMAHIGTADVANMHEDRADTRTGKVVKLAVIALCVLTVVASDVHADLV
jgi:hypothetical protein